MEYVSSMSFTLASSFVFLTKLVISGILLTTSPIFVLRTLMSLNHSYLEFLFDLCKWISHTLIFFSKLFTLVFSVLKLFNNFFIYYITYFRCIGAVFNSPTSNLSAIVFKLFKLLRTLTNLLMSSWSTSASKAIKFF